MKRFVTICFRIGNPVSKAIRIRPVKIRNNGIRFPAIRFFAFKWTVNYNPDCKKIIYFFVVNLYIRAVKKMPFLFLGSSPCYYLFKCTRNNTPLFLIYSSCHRVCLSTTCLPVCENGAIIPLKNIFD